MQLVERAGLRGHACGCSLHAVLLPNTGHSRATVPGETIPPTPFCPLVDSSAGYCTLQSVAHVSEVDADDNFLVDVQASWAKNACSAAGARALKSVRKITPTAPPSTSVSSSSLSWAVPAELVDAAGRAPPDDGMLLLHDKFLAQYSSPVHQVQPSLALLLFVSLFA